MTGLDPERLRRLTLDRQLLLARRDIRAVDALRHLGGLNAQHRRSPYIALWSRLKGFRREELETALASGQACKATLMRGTLHLVADDDYPLFFAGLAKARLRAFRSFFPQVAPSIPEERVQAVLRDALRTAPVAFRDLERLLAPDFPGWPLASLSFAAKALAPIVQLPPAGHWHGGGAPLYGWAGHVPGPAREAAEEYLMERYLAAFGPATLQDFAQWSGLGVGEAQAVRKRLGDRLTGSGPLLDLWAPPAAVFGEELPVRFLARWDNLLLAYRDRSRLLDPDLQQRVVMRDGRVLATFLVAGQVAGTWDVEETARQTTLVLQPLRSLAGRWREQLAREAEDLCRWLRPDRPAALRLAQ